jgi:hypothetical protein
LCRFEGSFVEEPTKVVVEIVFLVVYKWSTNNINVYPWLRNYNFLFLLGNRYSKKSGLLGTKNKDKSVFYISRTRIAVGESGEHIHNKSGRKWGRGLCSP